MCVVITVSKVLRSIFTKTNKTYVGTTFVLEKTAVMRRIFSLLGIWIALATTGHSVSFASACIPSKQSCCPVASEKFSCCCKASHTTDLNNRCGCRVVPFEPSRDFQVPSADVWEIAVSDIYSPLAASPEALPYRSNASPLFASRIAPLLPGRSPPFLG